VRLLALAVLLGFSWANRAGCCWLAGHTPYTVRPSPPGPRTPPPAQPPALRALLFADFGDDTCQQAEVAKAMAGSNARAPFDLAFSAGDNIYECGPDPRLPGAAACAFAPDGNTVTPGYRAPDDPRFRKLFEAALSPIATGGRPVPVFLALGNHDQNTGKNCREGDLDPGALGRARACLEVAHQGPQWRMPGRHYTVDEGGARFVVLDSNLLVADYGGFTLDGEVAFLREATKGCELRPCFVVAHHPPASAAHGDGDASPADDEFADRVRRLQGAASAPVAAWLSGHDHDLQHLRSPAGFDVFVSGNGSRWRDEKFEKVRPAGTELFFASTAWGFAVLEVWPAGWSVRFEDVTGKPLHCCQATYPGNCRPVACGELPRGPSSRGPASP
jgi:tartrate-resistant acid phosphatase type 5